MDDRQKDKQMGEVFHIDEARSGASGRGGTRRGRRSAEHDAGHGSEASLPARIWTAHRTINNLP